MSHETAPDQIPPGFKLRHTLTGHRGEIFRLVWSPDGRTLASGSHRGILLWDAEAGRLLHILEGFAGQLKHMQWSQDSRTLTSTHVTGAILYWDAETGKLLKTMEQKIPPRHVAASPDGEMIAVWGFEPPISLFKGTELLRSLEGKSFGERSGAWSPGGRLFASGDGAGVISLWDVETGKLTVILEGHTDAVNGLSFSFDGRLLASKSVDRTVRLWRCDTWKSVAVLTETVSFRSKSNLAFNPRLPVLATPSGQDKVIHVWDLDFDAVVNAAPRRQDVLYTTAKVTLVGDSGTGKTGLGWRLAHGEFKEHPSTHGQQFWVIDELGATRSDGTQCEAVLWDLAGQPDYRLVHALFLGDVDLALVLFDPTNRQEPLKGVEYWLKQLARARRDGRRRRVILVGARADRGVPTLTREELEEFCRQHGVDGGYVGTSALTGEGLAELMARVKASIMWEEMPATVTTKTFKRVKEFVLGMKEDAGRTGVLVSPAELRARLEATDARWEFTDAEMMTAVRHLSNHGYVSVLRGSSGEETILLAPDLLANLAASFVLEARRNPRGLGALDEARVLQGGYEFPEFAGLDERERDVLLDAAVALFIEHNLCFRETLGAQTFLIFPALINQKRPQLEEVETEDDFSYRVTGAVENVYAALVVQLGYTNTFTRTNQWQYQAEYETARGDVCGFRQADEREGEIELVLYHAKERAGARLLFQGLFEEFLRGRDVSVMKFPPVGCHECGYRQQRSEVIKRITEGKGFLFCGECGEKITLPKAGEEVALSRADRERLDQDQERTRRRTEFESALVRVKAVVRDERLAAPSCFVSYAWGHGAHERWVRGFARDLENAGVLVILDRRDNPRLGANVARFISRIEQSDFVVVVGTPLYRRKYENRFSAAGSVVAAEVNLINLRLTRTNAEAETVLPLLVEGHERASLPPLMQGKVYGNFLDERLYFASLFDLILTLYRIRFDHPAVSDLRDALRAGAGRWR